MNIRNVNNYPIRDISKRELTILEQATQVLPGLDILPVMREAMVTTTWPVVDDEEWVIIRKSEIPLGAWIGLDRHIPKGSPSQLVEDENGGPALVVERSILDMILEFLSAIISKALGMLGGEKSGPPRAGKPAQGGSSKPRPGRDALLIEHDGPGF